MRSRLVLLPTLVLLAACGEPDELRPEGATLSATGIESFGSGTQATGTAPDDADDTAGLRLDAGTISDMFAGDTNDEECDGLVATVRDFQSSHPDFETYTGNMAYVGLVMPMLGGDQTPVFNPGYMGDPMITSQATFDQWYHDVPGTNMSFPIELALTEEVPGEFSYDSSAFFPIDDMGFGNEGNEHNFHFTTEVHTSFTYEGGEVFTFRGDDDLWMFVNGQLALDLGGLHPAVEGSVQMDALGLTPGQTYPMDIFHAERHTSESNFRIVTTIECFVTPPPPG
ncbi:fibro-slime domain-containing protein [Paraliomyxa miuraensis]|uniref:fibro-slime domain-containing protein n=1 Tax=Paraliomyxa miuraensis TaxID=376150 RepID=UPI0022518481|nr:fibro-slime domain-containing protein [Paraliomyxa miuraensis]MCX4242018.1 fibro-slime domain-containing protein [Paraliomyxa miuraensis]